MVCLRKRTVSTLVPCGDMPAMACGDFGIFCVIGRSLSSCVYIGVLVGLISFVLSCCVEYCLKQCLRDAIACIVQSILESRRLERLVLLTLCLPDLLVGYSRSRLSITKRRHSLEHQDLQSLRPGTINRLPGLAGQSQTHF